MVKLGGNLSDKLEKQPSEDDGFDNIPLINPLEVNQLRHSFAEKVVVKTSKQFEPQQKTKKKQNAKSFYRNVSDKTKITGLIFISLAFLTSLLLLLMYKAMWYDQLTCPEGFILQQKHCSPADLEMFYTEQQERQRQQQQEEEERQEERALRLNQVKRRGPEPPSPWLPATAALKEQQRGGVEAEE